MLREDSLFDHFPRNLATLPLDEACAAWETLHYLLGSILGWDDRAKGLAWWYSAGKPTGDSRALGLIKRLWDQDGHLDHYAAWLWWPRSGCFGGEFSPKAVAHASVYCRDIEWWRAFKRRGKDLAHGPFYGGTNALHLGHSDNSIDGAFAEDIEKPILMSDVGSRSGVLVVSSIGTWRSDLRELGSQLPSLGERSWRVEVFDRAAGYLGLFRQSRVTKHWFAGKHSIHVRGCASRYTTLGELFFEEPEQWGLRGDPFLWRDMRSFFCSTPLLVDADELEVQIEEAFLDLSGRPMSGSECFFVEKYAHGGMSSGMVSPEFWRDRVVPLLKERYRAATSGEKQV